MDHETPKIGDGATYTVWTDRHACTVIAVSKSGKVITLQRDKATLVGKPGMCNSQEYTYEPNTEGRIYKVSRRERNGEVRWKLVGQRTNCPGGYAHFGGRSEYYDREF